MSKRVSLIGVISALICVPAIAGNLYFGPMLFVQDNTTPTSNYRGLHPRLSVGYAEMYSDFYFAGEAFAVPTTATIADNHSNGATSARSRWSYGASLIPGGMITENVLGYARVGVVSTMYTSPNTSRTGGQVGLGMQTSLTPYWDLRAEYSYTAYKTVPTLGAVKSDQVGVGLVYKVIG